MNSIEEIKKEAIEKLKNIKSKEELELFKFDFLGRKRGKLTELLKSLSSLGLEERKKLGNEANLLKDEIELKIEEITNSIGLNYTDQNLKFIDITTPPPEIVGSLHPISLVTEDLEQIFKNIGFTVLRGPELVNEYDNFEVLNIPRHHPARETMDTFYVKEYMGESVFEENGYKMLMRPHISSMQVPVMKKYNPPFAVVIPGRVFRNEATDARHEHTYDYMEGIFVDKNVSVANMKYVLSQSLGEFFGSDTKIQLRPSFFPFVEPGFEVWASCAFCKGNGCSVCSQGGWMEVLGAGIIHPKVFEYAGYESGLYTGFAFGFGLSRFAMIKYGIPDIRLLTENDLKFLKQF